MTQYGRIVEEVDKIFFFKQKAAYEVRLSRVGSEMCIKDSTQTPPPPPHLPKIHEKKRGQKKKKLSD